MPNLLAMMPLSLRLHSFPLIMRLQVRMCLVTAVFSSFVNDTPVFCIMLPIVLTWAAKARLPIRQLLIPLSYCCLLGGLNTVIGTSTNLVVTGGLHSVFAVLLNLWG
jgi:Na+/H+ antiporter NhaD/arsenite permease-like protein